MNAYSFLWYDLETFGTDTRLDRIAQFAAIRTDAALNETGETHNLYCRPTDDYLPDPAACLVTGITPQHAHTHGLAEPAFARALYRAFAQPGTLGTGYNTLRFDDEFVRHLFWRNFIDPYAREWQNGCGRWDILDLIRCAHALRPEGIVWPQNEDGTPSLRLEHLSAANGLEHEAAHDALSDVRATIALARLVRQAQPRLFDYCLKLRNKQHVRAQLAPLVGKAPFLHISGMYGYAHGNCAIVWPLAWHPCNQNELIVWDLREDPA
ncbi:MAG: exodeoxyribonuclease I, partial [Rhodocyclaceae bacterium]|nr:exodeoxyribonuclease I [Rhodocyclaceae bacterium]